MVSTNPASPPLHPQLYEDWDDDEDLRLKAPLNALINGTQDSLQAARDVDDMVRSVTYERLQKAIDYANSHSMTAEEREWGDWSGNLPPNATGYVRMIIGWYCRVSTAFSPYSEGQDRLIKFLEALRDLPRWMAPNSRPDVDGEVYRYELWAFEHNWLGLEDQFRKYEGSRSSSC
jgi:hypothetical protein